MNKSSLIGFVLIAAILFAWMMTMPRDQQKNPNNAKQNPPAVTIDETSTPDSLQTQELSLMNADSIETPLEELDPEAIAAQQYTKRRNEFGAFASSSEGEEQFWVIENKLQRITISNKGGCIKKVELKDYKTYSSYKSNDSTYLVCFYPETSKFDMTFVLENAKTINTSNLYFEPYIYHGEDMVTHENDSVVFAMRAYTDGMGGQHNEGQYIEFVYTLFDNNYMLDFDLRTVGMNDVLDNNYHEIYLDWQVDLLQNEKHDDRFINTTVYYKTMADNDVDRLSKDEDQIPSSINWVSFKERFFCNVLVAKKGFKDALVRADQNNRNKVPGYFKTMGAGMNIPLTVDESGNFEFPMSFYFGPNHFKTLKSYGLGLQHQIDVGRFFLIRWINYGVIYVFDWLGSYGWSYGIVILILTILIKLLLFPIAFKSYKSTAVTRLLKPEMEAIAAKYPKEEDAMKKQQAVMNLQRQAGVSPAAGCIPMLLQFPILIAVFRFFPSSIELRQKPFLWADDLSTYDSVLDLSHNIPFYGDHVSLFCLLMTITTFIYTYVNNRQMDTAANPQMKGMKIMMYLMPILFLGIFNSYSAGLSYYYMLANIITFIQMFLFRALIDENKIRLKIEENKKKPVKKSRFMQRLEAAQKAQQQQLKNAKR